MINIKVIVLTILGFSITSGLAKADIVAYTLYEESFGQLNLTFSRQITGNSGPVSLVSWDYLCGTDYQCSENTIKFAPHKTRSIRKAVSFFCRCVA